MIVTDYLVNKMTKHNIIGDDKDLYIYGLNNGFTIIINVLTAVFLAYIVQKVDLLLFLLVSFIPLRSYCGGIHCKSRLLCYIYSNIIITILLITQNIFSANIYFYAFVTLISSVFIYITKTTGNSIRHLEVPEIRYYTHIKRTALLIIIIASIFSFFIKEKQYSTTMLTSINLTAILLVLESIKNKIANTKFFNYSIK